MESHTRDVGQLLGQPMSQVDLPLVSRAMAVGAGFAFVGSLFVLVATFFLAAGTILIWPIAFLWRHLQNNP